MLLGAELRQNKLSTICVGVQQWSDQNTSKTEPKFKCLFPKTV